MQRPSKILINHEAKLTLNIRYCTELAMTSYDEKIFPVIEKPARVVLWSSEQKEKVSTREGKLTLGTNITAASVFSDDCLAVGDYEGQVHLFYIKNLKKPVFQVTIPAAKAKKDPVSSLAPCPDDLHYVVGYTSGKIRLFNLDQPGIPQATLAPCLGAPVFIFMDHLALNYIAGKKRGHYQVTLYSSSFDQIINEALNASTGISHIIYDYWRKSPRLFKPIDELKGIPFNGMRDPVKYTKRRW